MYHCGCEDCQKQSTVLNLGISNKFKQLLNDGEKAFKHLHKKGNYKPEDLQTEKPYQKLIQSTFDAFDFAIQDNDMPEVMRTALQDNARLFGSLKTNAQLFEASKLLLNDSGKLKPFSEVSKDFDKLNVNYNQNYLEAEYEFAVASSQAAAQWANLGDRYNLQYRTAQDERVRASHQALADITLPKEDPFWSMYYPPNGWRCRCVAVEVLKGKYDESNSEKAVKAAEKATTEIGKDGKNRLEIFRFNPGAQKVVFPPVHPYTKVAGAKEIKTRVSKTKKAPKPKEVKKGIEYKNLSFDDYKNAYKNQIIDKSNEKIIMGGEDGYVATGNSFRLNEMLRNGYNLDGEDKKTVNALDSLISKNQLKDNIMLHRNVDDDFIGDKFGFSTWGKETKDIIQRIKDSNITSYSDGGFCSTSAIEKKNVFQQRKIQLKIQAKEGTNAYITSNASESEIILSRNQKFNIVSVEEIKDDRIKIVVETD